MPIDFSDTGFEAKDFDFEDIDAGGVPEPGVYRVKLVKVATYDEPRKTPSENLSFRVICGTQRGQRGKIVTERLFLNGSDDDKHRRAIQRLMAWGKRMGLYTKEMAAKMAPLDFNDAIGKEFILKINQEDWIDDKGNNRKSARCDYMGIWMANSPDAPECPKDDGSSGKPAGDKPSPPKAGNTAKPKPKQKDLNTV